MNVSQIKRIIAEPMLVPMCDAVMTLIVIFIMTMPAVLWSGFNVDATRAAAAKKEDIKNASSAPKQVYAAVSITKEGLYFNGTLTSEKSLFDQIKEWVAKISETPQEKMIVILPDDDIVVDKVVRVFDIAQLAGAEKFALLEPANKK